MQVKEKQGWNIKRFTLKARRADLLQPRASPWETLGKPLIAQVIKKELYSYMASILEDCDCSPIIIGGIENHVHVLCKLSKTRSMSSVIEDIKKKSSK